MTIAGLYAIASPTVFAASVAWDPNNTPGGTATAPTGSGGTGSWTTSTRAPLSWSDSVQDVSWSNTTVKTALFGGTAGTVSVSPTGITINAVNFQTGGYTLSGGFLTLNAGTTITTVAASPATLISSPIAGANLIYTGAGALTLSGANTYTGGTAVNGGSLLINNTTGSGTGTGAVTVSNSGTVLGGSGTISGAVTLNSSAILSPGALSNGTGILSTGALTLQSNSTLSINLNGTTAGTLYDQLKVTGTINVTGSTLALSLGAGFTPVSTDKFFIGLNDGTDPITGAFASVTGLPAGFALVYNENGDGGSLGNDMAIVAVPEPSTWCAATLCVLAILYAMRRTLHGALASSLR